MIKLAVSSCLMHPDITRTTFGPKQLDYIENDMARYLASSDVMPVLMPDLGDDILACYMDEMDGLVLQGGADLAPETYGEAPIGRWLGDRKRDLYEICLIELALERNLPILGICRGMQLLNAFYGGTLYQDLGTQINPTIVHRDAVQYDSVHHSVEHAKDSLLAEVYETQTMFVNSVHHQGVKDLGRDLIVESICLEKNLVEAFRYRNLNEQFVWAVQWHPEFNHSLKGTIPSGTPIIERFVAEVKRRKVSQSG